MNNKLTQSKAQRILEELYDSSEFFKGLVSAFEASPYSNTKNLSFFLYDLARLINPELIDVLNANSGHLDNLDITLVKEKIRWYMFDGSTLQLLEENIMRDHYGSIIELKLSFQDHLELNGKQFIKYDNEVDLVDLAKSLKWKEFAERLEYIYTVGENISDPALIIEMTNMFFASREKTAETKSNIETN